MKKLIIMRHAQAQLEQYGKNDRERTITMAGMHEIDALRQRIHGKLEGVSLVICSNARRTRQTLEGIRPFLPNSADVQFDDSLYHASADSLWHKIQTTTSSHNSIMLVGHNPAVTQLTTAIDASIGAVFPTCGIAIFESNVDKWHEISQHNLRLITLIRV